MTTEYPSDEIYPGPGVYPGTDTGPAPSPPPPVSPYPPSLTATPIVAPAPDLVGDIPPYERQSHDILAVLTATGNELARVESARQELLDNFFPASADVLLGMFESMLGLSVNDPTLTLTARQSRVLAYMQSLKSAGTGLAWEQAVSAIAGTGWTYQEHDPNNADTPPAYTVRISLPFATSVNAPIDFGATGGVGTGTLPAGTYWYAVSATTAYGESIPCPAVSAALSAEGYINLSWASNAAPTTGYNIYRGGSAESMFLLASVAGATSDGFSDNGSYAASEVMPPTKNTTGSSAAYSVEQLVRQITPAHLYLEVGYSGGFIVGYSDIGLEPL